MKKYILTDTLNYPGLKGGKGTEFVQNESGMGYLGNPETFTVADTLVDGKIYLAAKMVENYPELFKDVSVPDSGYRVKITGIYALAKSGELNAEDAIKATLQTVEENYPDCKIEKIF